MKWLSYSFIAFCLIALGLLFYMQFLTTVPAGYWQPDQYAYGECIRIKSDPPYPCRKFLERPDKTSEAGEARIDAYKRLILIYGDRPKFQSTTIRLRQNLLNGFEELPDFDYLKTAIEYLLRESDNLIRSGQIEESLQHNYKATQLGDYSLTLDKNVIDNFEPKFIILSSLRNSAHYQYVTALIDQQRFEKASSALSHAFFDDSAGEYTISEGYLMNAEILAALNNWEDADKEIETHILKYPDAMYRSLAVRCKLMLNIGLFNEGADNCTQSIALKPNSDAYIQLGQNEERQNNIAGAIEYYELALRIPLLSTTADQIRNNIEKLKTTQR